jgi:hypothetical protein
MQQGKDKPMAELRELTGPFDLWARDAVPGSKIIYHTGEYASGPVCMQAMDAADAGLVLLVRKRADKPEQFYYIAVRAKNNGRKG